MSTELCIRAASAEDAGDMAALLSQLGYPTSSDAVRRRLLALRAEDDVVFVAIQSGRCIGLASVHLIPLFYRDQPLARITSLVIDEATRGRGVGSALIEACEKFARERNAERIEVTSGDQRRLAHEFYLGRGFAREGQRFTRRVPAP